MESHLLSFFLYMNAFLLSQGEELVYLSGKCCPECKPSVSSCVYPHLQNEVLSLLSKKIYVV